MTIAPLSLESELYWATPNHERVPRDVQQFVFLDFYREADLLEVGTIYATIRAVPAGSCITWKTFDRPHPDWAPVTVPSYEEAARLVITRHQEWLHHFWEDILEDHFSEDD